MIIEQNQSARRVRANYCLQIEIGGRWGGQTGSDGEDDRRDQQNGKGGHGEFYARFLSRRAFASCQGCEVIAHLCG